ncbi:MAG: peptidylprolyl isomerase, partial [Limnobacter sp.]|nr:peptidylprolyl isomerase [Limnobacter sp.]
MALRENTLWLGFVAVAGVIGAFEWLSPEQNDDRVIVVTPELRQFVSEQSKGNADQALALTLEDEVLYREGLQLGLDQNDLIVKRRVIQKMRFLIEASTPLSSPTSEQLQARLDKHPDQFVQDAEFKLSHHFFERSNYEKQAVARAEQALLQITMDEKAAVIASDPHPIGSSERWFTYTELVRELGKQAADGLLNMPTGQWSSPVTSAMGAHLFKVNERHEPGQLTVEQAGQALVAAVEQAQRER